MYNIAVFGFECIHKNQGTLSSMWASFKEKQAK
jgi:hypothetical protein